jgi:methylated-DNA-[protein]-cysteine S-methyltransferase
LMLEWTQTDSGAYPALRLVVSPAGLRAIEFGAKEWGEPPGQPSSGIEQPLERNDRHPLLLETLRQLRAYFGGSLREFDLPLDPAGTDFQKRVWLELLKIPYGETRSYSEVAIAVGSPKAVRAVGAANGANPIPIVVPCHRVIGSSGKLTGYGGGLELKKRLLDLESGTLF